MRARALWPAWAASRAAASTDPPWTGPSVATSPTQRFTARIAARRAEARRSMADILMWSEPLRMILKTIFKIYFASIGGPSQGVKVVEVVENALSNQYFITLPKSSSPYERQAPAPAPHRGRNRSLGGGRGVPGLGRRPRPGGPGGGRRGGAHGPERRGPRGARSPSGPVSPSPDRSTRKR